MSIFREEAIEARKVSYGLGVVRAPFPDTFRALIVVSIALTGFFLATALALPYGRGMNAKGVIIDRSPGEAVARVWVAEATVSDIQPGMDAIVRFPALPKDQINRFDGNVIEVSRAPDDRTRRDRYGLMVAVPLGPRNDGTAIAPGMVVEVHLTTPRRRLYQWIFASVRT